MKKVLTLLAVLFTAGLFAQNNTLVVFSENGERFYLILNGLRQNEKAETNVRVNGLNNQNYKAKIIFENKKPDLNANVYMMDGGNPVSNTEFTYAVANKKGKYKLRPISASPIPAAPVNTPNQVVYVFNPSGNAVQQTITNTGITVGGVTIGMGQTTTTTTNGNGSSIPNGLAVTTTGGTTTTTTTTTNGSPDNVNVGVNAGGVGVNVSVPTNGGVTTTQSTTTTTTTTGGTTTAGNGCMYAMNPTDFAKAKASVTSKSFEDSKLTVAKQILNTNCLSSLQVKEIMQQFTFEETKLDWAKFAYGKTTDRGNYFQLNDAFQYESSITELNNYMSTH